MTDVLKSNFKDLIPQIIDEIKTCTFVAIDAEYTGLFSPNPEYENSLFDTPSQRYEKLKNGFANFQISQFGMGICEKNWDSNKFFIKSYNFYLYPVAFHTFREKISFQCQVSSFNFLAENNFDFNKFIKEGIPYLRNDEALQAKNYLKNNRHFMSDIETRDKAYFPRYLKELNDEEIEEIVNHLIGFSKLIYAIQNFQKPIVGHNMLLDLLLIYKQFYESLPETFDVFKANIHEIFPIIFDTKNVVLDLRTDVGARETANSTDSDFLQDSTLLGLYKNITSIKNFFAPDVVFCGGSVKYRSELAVIPPAERSEGSHYHEAGFDACVTAGLFVYLSHIAFRQTARCPGSGSYSITAAELFSNLALYANHINIIRCTSNYINITGQDPLPTRPNWIRVSYPENRRVLNAASLNSQLTKFGDLEIQQLDSKSVVLACNSWGCARSIWNFLVEHGYCVSALEYTPSSCSYRSCFKTLKNFGIGVGLSMLLFGGLALFRNRKFKID